MNKCVAIEGRYAFGFYTDYILGAIANSPDDVESDTWTVGVSYKF